MLNNEPAQVNQFAWATGGEATIYARTADENFVSVTSSFKKGDAMLVGEVVDKQHPAYKILTEVSTTELGAAKPYVGRAVIRGKPYIVRYSPIKDGLGRRVIGALFIGFDLTVFQATLDKQINTTKFFDSGGIYILDPKTSPGEAIFMAPAGLAGKRAVDVNPAAADFLAALEASGEGISRNAAGLLNPGATDLWAVMRKSPSTGLWMVSEVSDSEAMRSHWATLWPFWGLLCGAALALGFGLFLMMRRWVAIPLRGLFDAVRAVSSGDLTYPVKSDQNDEIGTLVNGIEDMRVRLAQTLNVVRLAVERVSSASIEIADGNLNLSHRTEQTASILEETAASMSDANQTAGQSASSAQTASKLAGSASDVAGQGVDVVSEVVTTMSDISAASKKIADIIGLIDGIAFQTNILALNAAVEAARAGEQGRGFAVVAGEVRSLASRSAVAAKEIRALIGSTVSKVESGALLVNNAGKTMEQIMESVQKVSDTMNAILAAVSAQQQSFGRISSSVGQVEQMTQQNAAMVEESAAAASSLREQAKNLSDLVGAFRLPQDEPA